MKFRHLVLFILFISPLFSEEGDPQDCTEKSEEPAKKEDSCEEKKDEDKDKEDEDKDNDDEEVKPWPIGILAFPTSQQLSPLISIGQNIIDKGQFQLFFFGDAFLAPRKHAIDAVPNLVYGFTDEFSVYIEFLDYAISYRDKPYHSKGFEDTLVQFEYAFYNHSEKLYVDQATIIAGIYFPTGSARKNPNTGFGTPTFTFGSTFSRTGAYWYWFTSYGANLTFSHNGLKIGNQYLYQAGIGRYITTINPDWLFCWLIEADGTYFEHNKFRGKTVPDSGGSVLFITPSIWVSSCNWRFQLGVGYAVQQYHFGRQNNFGWLYVLDFGYTFG